MSHSDPSNHSDRVFLGLESFAIAVGLLITLTGAVMGVEMRYAKTAEVQNMVDEVYLRTVRLRILELELKDRSQMPAHEKALLEHLKRELSK